MTPVKRASSTGSPLVSYQQGLTSVIALTSIVSIAILTLALLPEAHAHFSLTGRVALITAGASGLVSAAAIGTGHLVNKSLYYSIKTKNFSNIKKILKDSPKLISSGSIHPHNKVKILHLSIKNNDLETVRQMLDNNADTQERIHATNALELAAKTQNKDIISLLIEKGATSPPSTEHSSALTIATQSGCLDIVKILTTQKYQGCEKERDIFDAFLAGIANNDNDRIISYLYNQMPTSLPTAILSADRSPNGQDFPKEHILPFAVAAAIRSGNIQTLHYLLTLDNKAHSLDRLHILAGLCAELTKEDPDFLPRTTMQNVIISEWNKRIEHISKNESISKEIKICLLLTHLSFWCEDLQNDSLGEKTTELLISMITTDALRTNQSNRFLSKIINIHLKNPGFKTKFESLPIDKYQDILHLRTPPPEPTLRALSVEKIQNSNTTLSEQETKKLPQHIKEELRL